MNPFKALAPITTLLLFGTASLSAAPVSGQTVTFTSPGGLEEACIRIEPMPGAHYGKHDLRDEKNYCELDLYELALCPKLWSTSPGTILYEVAGDTDPVAFESAHCGNGHHAGDAAKHKPGAFKMSVNDRDTSATYAPSSWVYYHFSRFFEMGIHVPVAVYRSMDASEHNRRVVTRGLELSGGHRNLRMLAAGWRFLDRVERGQGSAASARAVLTDEGRQVFGTLIDNKGDRYGPEINGTRESGWGSGQNHDFQMTAPFLALRSGLPLAEATSAAIHEARKNPRMAKALSADTPVVQVIFWMQDVLEIVLLDYLLGQQDRIGNIDYNWRWYWVEDGKLESKAAHGREPSDELKPFSPVRLRQSAINDNDAGVRRGYANFAQKTSMLDGLRHFHPGLYRKLATLAADLGAKGERYAWLTGPAGLSTSEADAIARRAVEAFSRLRSDCEAGRLALDLDPGAFLGAEPIPAVSCDAAAQ